MGDMVPGHLLDEAYQNAETMRADLDYLRAEVSRLRAERDALRGALGEIAGQWYAWSLAGPSGEPERFGCACPERARKALDLDSGEAS